MNSLTGVLLAAAVIGIAAVGAALWHSRRETRRIMERLSRMLDEAVSGNFSEERYDESLLSAVELKMSRYLDECAVSSRNLAGEKEEIQTLIADISHQTKTPIANILLYAQLLNERELPEDCGRPLEALAAQAEKLNFLIGALVKLSRLETGIIAVSPGENNMAELIGAVRSQAAPLAAGKGVDLTAACGPGTAVFDPKWTGEALYNLVDNAVKYTPAGGHVTVTAVWYSLFCRIDVADDGIGIAEGEHSAVFSRFYRSPAVSDRPGVGLGLFLAREIAARQGGYLKLASAPGEGSVFSLFLPTPRSGGESF